MVNRIMIANAIAEFVQHLTSNIGKPISLNTVNAFVVMVGKVLGALPEED